MRVITAIAAFHYIDQPTKFLPLYIVSCLLDAVDGTAARYFNQGKKKSHFQLFIL